jgi:hypothetical protein
LALGNKNNQLTQRQEEGEKDEKIKINGDTSNNNKGKIEERDTTLWEVRFMNKLYANAI